MKKIALLDPQPNEHGLFSTGFTRLGNLDGEGRHIHDPDWDLKSVGGPSIPGVWLAEFVEDKNDWMGMGGYAREGRFSRCPIDATVEELFGDLVKPVKFSDGWWWVDYR